jgi:hypothetical protein
MGANAQAQTQARRRPPRALNGGGRFVSALNDFVPAYLKAYQLGLLTEKVAAAQELLRSCRVCPRDCGVNRWENKTGVCKTGRYARVSRAFPHFGEEDCLRGKRGSGTIFLAGCNLGCVFCQNYEISQLGDGQELDAGRLGAVMLRLQEAGCHNINFVTPEHVVPGSWRRYLSRSKADCGCRWSITPGLTTALRACGCWTVWWTFTCPTSSYGTRNPAPGISGPATIPKSRVAR